MLNICEQDKEKRSPDCFGEKWNICILNIFISLNENPHDRKREHQIEVEIILDINMADAGNAVVPSGTENAPAAIQNGDPAQQVRKTVITIIVQVNKSF